MKATIQASIMFFFSANVLYFLPTILFVKLQTWSEGLGVDFTFAMEQEQEPSPKFLGWDGTRGLKFGNLT